ncbi:MAG: MerR family transcriptional regulator [Proteobacteria bacterium]|nr:MerR family transcriptional regulator [Pseudomonadota bacterium]
MAEKTLLKIGELSRKANVTPRTVRFYVQEGLLPEPEHKQKNLALYGPDCVEKIRAVKRAQNERFLPLMVIRRILEQSDYDYSALDDVDVPAFTNGAAVSKEVKQVFGAQELDVPQEVLVSLKRKKLIRATQGHGGEPEYDPDDSRLMHLLAVFNRNGLKWDDLLNSLERIQGLVENIAELEFQALLSGAMNNPTGGFQELLLLEEKTLQSFIDKVRRRSLKNRITRYKSDLDYAFLASADEGYAVQTDEILPDIEELERHLKPRSQDIRLLNDLALGYSCLGNLERSLRYLRRIRKFAPDDLETQLRWIWYRRFTQRQQDQKKLKKQMEKLVSENPNFAVGRAFMAVWYAFDTLGADDPYEIFHLTRLCLNEMEEADRNLPDDLHEWTLIHYIKGRLFGQLLVVPGNQENGTSAFESILRRQDELDRYYSEQKSFFSKWLWPNVYFFLGGLYNQTGRFDEARELLYRGRNCHMMPPYRDRLESEINTARGGE